MYNATTKLSIKKTTTYSSAPELSITPQKNEV